MPDGKFAVLYRSQVWYPTSTMYLRIFHADGTPDGDLAEVAPEAQLDNPQLAADAAGNLLAVWEKNVSSTTPDALREMWGRRFDRDGAPQGDAFLLHATTAGARHLTPSMRTGSGGDFLVAWNDGSASQGGDVYARRFAADGSPLGSAFLVAQNGLSPIVNVNEAGTVLIGWRGVNADGDATGHAYARRYAADGSALGAPFEIAASANTPSLAQDGDGSFLAAWLVDGLVYRKWFVEPLPELPDLQVSGLTAPEAVTIGQPFEVQAAIYNHGLVAVASFPLQFYLSPDPEITGAGNDRLLLATPVTIATMWGGTTTNLTRSVVSADLVPGAYSIAALADDGNTVNEADETNNVHALPIELCNPPVATGPEFPANTTTSGDQTAPSVVVAPDGSYWVIWSGRGSGDDQGIFMQRFSAAQVPLGPERRVNQTVANAQSQPSAAADDAGNFTVVWTHDPGNSSDDVYARRFAADGTPLTDEFLVNSYTANHQHSPDIALTPDGGFLVAWLGTGLVSGSSNDVVVRRFDAADVALAEDAVVSPPGGCSAPALAASPSGSFLVSWILGGWDIQYRVFDADGAPTASAQTLPRPANVYNFPPSLAANAAGEMLLVWHGMVLGSPYSSGEIYGQWFSPALEPRGEPFLVNTYRDNQQQYPRVSALPDGDFLVAWASPDSDSLGIRGQRFSADGHMIGGEWPINTFITSAQDVPAVAGWDHDSFVVVWASAAQDGSGSGVYGQVFGGVPVGEGDLAVTEIAPLRGSYEGQTAPVSAVVSNRGPGALGKFKCQYYLSVDRTITADDIPLGATFEVGALAGWQAYRDSRSVTLPDRLGGIFYLGLVADTADEVTELHEENNVLVSAEPGVIGPLPDVLGTELRVNETTSGDQLNPVAARQPDGSSLVVWEGKGAGDDYGIFLRRFDAAGQSLGAEILVNTYTAGTQGQPALAVDETGKFVVVWESAAQDGSGYGIFGQRFTAAAVPVGSELAINTVTSDNQRYPSVGMDRHGNFTVVWNGSSSPVCFRQYDASGTPLGDERQAPGAMSRAYMPHIGMAADGTFVIAWRVNDPGLPLFLQRFAADGSALAAASQVNSVSSNEPPRIGMGPGGQFVVVWRSPQSGNEEIYARRYAADGVPVSGEFVVNSDTASDQSDPQVSVTADGGFAVVWTSNAQDGSGTGVYGKRYAADGSSLEGEFAVPVTTVGNQQQPHVAAAGGDGIVVVWSSQNVDGSGYAICAQLVTAPAMTLPAAQSPPYTEGFEAGDLETLTGWQFTQTGSGTWQVTDAGSPHTGTWQLQAGQSAADASVQEAVLKLDLSAVATRTDLELDFWIQHTATATSRLRISPDGGKRSWTFGYLIHPVSVGQYEHFTFDLDALLRTAGITADEDVYVRFSHVGSSSAQVITLDDLRVDDEDLFGPRIIAQNPTGVGDGPVSTIQVTFDEPIDVATFTAADVNLAGPAGATVVLAGDPVDSGDHRTFNIPLAVPWSTSGTYVLTIGPDIRDPLGNAMNQDADALNGETNGHDTYQNAFQILPTPAPSLPHVEGFETADLGTLPAWTLARTIGTITVGNTNPHAGQYALQMGYGSYTYDNNACQDAILHVDLAGQTDVVLGYWLKEISGGGRSDDFAVSVSADGVTWTTLATIAGSSSWQRFMFNLDLLPLAYSDDVQIKFHHNNYYAGGFALDDIRVQAKAPAVFAHWPTGEVMPGATVLRFDFDEPMDTSSFSLAEDVLAFDGPAGDLRGQLTGFSWLDSDTLEVTFAAQLAPGRYHLDLGPGVLDPAGKPLDQDGDLISDETADDVYRACFTVTGDFAVQFDGSNDLVAVPDSASLRMTSSLTMEAWIFPTGPGSGSGGTGGTIINKEGEYELVRFADGTIQYALATAQNQWTPWVNTGYVVPLATWAHVAVTGAEGIWKTYVDGELVHTWNGPSSLGDAVPAQNELRIGGRMAVSQYFRGFIDNVRVWNYARTQDEIRAGLNGGVTGLEPGLAGAWNFDELPANSQAVLDLSPYHHDGTLGATSSVASDDPLRIARDHAPNIVAWQLIEDSGFDPEDAITSDSTPLVKIQFSEAVLGQASDLQVLDPLGALVSPLEVRGWGTCELTLRFAASLTTEGRYRVVLNEAGIHDVTLHALSGGAELPWEFVLDTTPPRVTGTSPAAVHAGGSTPGPVTQIAIDFAEELSPADAAAPAHYELRRAVNGVFDDADDVVYALAPSYVYESGTLSSRTTLDLGLGGAPLPFGTHRLIVRGDLSAALHDLAGNRLDGDSDGAGGPDYVRIFSVPETLLVSQFTGTGSGFVAEFNRALELSVLNLYDGAAGGLGPADAVLRTSAGTAVAGSIVADAGGRKIEFVATVGPLAPDLYTVTLTSAAAGFRDPAGSVLDGDRDGVSGGDFTTQFTVATPPADTRLVSLPDMARGAGQSVKIPNAAAGLPIRLDNAAGVTSLAVDLRYDPDLLRITAAALGAGLPGDWNVINPPDTSAPGVAKIRASGTTALSGTNVDVVRLTAAVPSDASYGASQAIRLENVSLNEGAIGAVGDVAVHKAVYLGDADGSGIHSSADAFLTVQAALGLASGFAAHAWTDPRIVGDADGSGVLSAADAFLIVQEGLGPSEPFVPNNPHIGVTPVGGGVDPQFQIGVDLPASVGGLVTVPVKLDIEPAATNVGAFEFDLFFDPAQLTIQLPEGVSAGADTGGWAVSAILLAPCQLRVGMVSSPGQPLAPGLREIARLLFRVESSRVVLRPVPDGSQNHPALLRTITDHRLLITDALDGSETHPTVLDIEPVDARTGGYTWTDADGSVLIRPAERALAGARRERVWDDLDAQAELLESVLNDLAHEIAAAWRRSCTDAERG